MITSVLLSAVLILSSPSQAIDDSSAYLVWNNVQNVNISDYVVYVDDKKRGETSSENFSRTNPLAYSYANSFFDYYTKERTNIKSVHPSVCSFFVDNLNPDTEYKFRVAAVDDKGKEILISKEISVRTLPYNKEISVVAFGAESINAERKQISFSEDKKSVDAQKKLIRKNTSAIQNAIDSCPAGGTVLVPSGDFICGSIYLKSDMTLRIDGNLIGSPYASDYDFGFLMYRYYTDTRRFGLINADGAENIKICGSGTVDGSGWLYCAGASEQSYESRTYSENGDDKKNPFPFYMHSNYKTVQKFGLLASSCVEEYLKSVDSDFNSATDSQLKIGYSQRSTLVILRNINNLFISGLTFKNPANHTINIIDSQNIAITGIKEFTFDCNNGDGIGLICSQHALIWNNVIDTGDDSIVFSSGVGSSAFTTGEKGVSDVRIFNNYIHHGHGGVAFGSHTALGISDVLIEDNIFSHTDIPFRFKSAQANGGGACNVVFRNNAVAECVQFAVFTTSYSDTGTISPYGAAETPAVFHDILVKNISVYGVEKDAISYYAVENFPHYDIVFENVNFSAVRGKGKKSFDENKKFIKCRNVKFIN